MARVREIPRDPVAARIEDLDQDGRGVARVEGKVVFIEQALKGEEVLFSYRRRRGRFDEGVLAEIRAAAPERVQPRCPHFGRCGGCSLQHLAHAAQVEIKQARLLATLRRLGHVEPARLYPALQAEPWGYRRRARLGVRFVPGKGGALVGFREKHSAKLAELAGCAVLEPAVGGRLPELRALVTSLDAARRVPQLEVAVGENECALVLRHLDPLSARDRATLTDFGRRYGLQIHLQAGGAESLTALWPAAPALLRYRLPDDHVELEFGPTDFVQVNAAVNRLLVARTLELLDLEPRDRVLDLYCGIGNFTLPIARRAGEVVGAEGAVALVRRARANATRNALTQAQFRVADLASAESASCQLAEGWDKLMLDPPRSGAAAVVSSLRAPLPRRVVYVSCNPATLARDAATLVHEHGYRLAGAGLVDMFPHTSHIEALALFEAS